MNFNQNKEVVNYLLGIRPVVYMVPYKCLQQIKVQAGALMLHGRALSECDMRMRSLALTGAEKERRQMARFNAAAFGHDHYPLYDIFKFADIPGQR